MRQKESKIDRGGKSKICMNTRKSELHVFMNAVKSGFDVNLKGISQTQIVD